MKQEISTKLSPFTALVSSWSSKYLRAASKLENFSKSAEKGQKTSAAPTKFLQTSQDSPEWNFPSKEHLGLLMRWTLIIFQ